MREHWDWKRVQAICGVKINMVAYVEVSEGTAEDAPYLGLVTEKTARHGFTLARAA